MEMGRGPNGDLYRSSLDHVLAARPRDLCSHPSPQAGGEAVQGQWESVRIQARRRPTEEDCEPGVQGRAISALDTPFPRTYRRSHFSLHGYHIVRDT